MRTAFLVLLLGNLGFFAWARYIAPADPADGLPLTRQIDPEKVKVVAAAELPPPAAPKPAAAPSPAPAPSAPAVPSAAAPQAATQAAAPAAPKCMEWGSFALADTPRAEKSLEPLALGGRLGQRRTEETAGWWVYIPPQARAPNPRQAAVRKSAELKALGVEDYFIVQEEGENRWAVSLGVYRTEDAARARLAALRGQGVRSARVGPRETVVPKVWLQISGVDAALEAKLKDVAAQVEATELRACP